MHLQITHHTRYDYDREVQLLAHLIYLRPRQNPLLDVKRFELSFSSPAQLHWMRDDFENLPASVQFPEPATYLEVHSECDVVTADLPPFDFLVRDYAVNFPFNYEPLHRFNLSLYLTPPNDATQVILRQWLDANFVNRPTETVPWLFALNQTITRTLCYSRRDEPGIQSPETTITQGIGSCRDFAVLFIECARTLGVAARFVSGYMFDPAATDDAAFSMHAWTEVFIPGAGWRGLDPTHGIFCTNAYIPIAHAVVAESVNPIQGSFFSEIPATSAMSVKVRVRRIDQTAAPEVFPAPEPPPSSPPPSPREGEPSPSLTLSAA